MYWVTNHAEMALSLHLRLTGFYPSSFSKCFVYFLSGVLLKVIEAAIANASARTLCRLGDDLILQETGQVYKKEKELKKGTNNFSLWNGAHFVSFGMITGHSESASSLFFIVYC